MVVLEEMLFYLEHLLYIHIISRCTVGTDQGCGQREVQLLVSHSDDRSSNQSYHQHPERAGSSLPTAFHPCWNYKLLASQLCGLREKKMEGKSEKSGLKVVFLCHNKMDSLPIPKKPISHFYSPQSISSDSSAQSALLSHTRWDSMQWPLRHTKSVTAGQLTGSTTSKTQTDKHRNRSEGETITRV